MSILLVPVGAFSQPGEAGSNTSGLHWQYIGHQGLYPRYNGKYSNTIGQGWINSIWVDPDDHDFILAGSHNAGIWKTTDGGDSWVSITENEPLIKGIKSIWVSPANRDSIAVATCTLDRYSSGLFSTSDGGKTWSQNKVYIKEEAADLYPTPKKKYLPVKWIIHPGNHRIMYLLTWTRVLMSSNGGKSWKLALDRPDYNVYIWQTGFKDIEFDPADPSTVYVAGVEIHRLSKRGSKVDDLTPLFLENMPIDGAIRKVMIGVRENFPGKIWFNNFISSDKAGYFVISRYLTAQDSVDHLGSQKVLDHHKMQCEVSPVNENHIMLGGILTRFFDADHTRQFYSISATDVPENWTHVDVRDLEYLTDPAGNEVIFVANDGGVFKAGYTAPGEEWNWTYLADDGTDGIQNSEIKGFDCSEGTDDVIYAGFQDMNAAVYDNGQWYSVLAGDGSSGVIDPEDPDRIYGSYYGRKATIRKSADRGVSFQFVISVDNKIPPMLLKPDDPGIMYIGGRRKLYRFNNIRETREFDVILEIEPDPDPAPEGIHFSGHLRIDELAISASDPDVIYLSTDRYFPGWAKNIRSKALFKSADGGASWTDLSDEAGGTLAAGLETALKRGPVSGIAIHPGNPGEVWICFQNFYDWPDAELVWFSKDGGKSWNAASRGLDAVFPANDLQFDPESNLLYLATDMGVFVFDKENEKWITLTGNLPPAVVNFVRFNHGLKKIRIATYGRGIWQADLPDRIPED